MRQSRFWTQILPAVVIVVALWVTISFRVPQSGLDVGVLRAGTPVVAHISVGFAGRHETLATRSTNVHGRVRFNLNPGRYMLTVTPHVRGIGRRTVLVRKDRYIAVHMHSRARRHRSRTTARP